jgi:hypothetical protein
MKQGVLFLLILAFFRAPLAAQEDRPVIQFIPLSMQGLGPEEARIIESLIESYIAAQGVLVVASGGADFSSFRPSPASDVFPGENAARPPDYTLSGSISLERDSRILMLEIGKPAAGELTYYTSAHRSTSELVLKIRSLIGSAFAPGPNTEQPRTEEPEILTESRVVGTWQGDTGIAMIRLRRGGRGTAFFSSGVQMELSYRIDQNTLKVTQISPNTERYYHPVPYGVAKQLVFEAEPMRWELLLHDQGKVLKGIKIATAVRYEEDRVLETLPQTARDAEWTRSSR